MSENFRNMNSASVVQQSWSQINAEENYLAFQEDDW